MTRRAWVGVGIGSLVAWTAASCGPDMLSDAGHVLMDAGDAMSRVGDATTNDAAAQACATNCSAAGTQRILTADSDPAQLERATVRLTDDAFTPVVEGPLVLTDASITSSSGSGQGALLVVKPRATGCGTDPVTPSDPTIRRLTQQSVDVAEATIQGGRYFVRADEVLCAHTSVAGVVLSWAGFRPYP